MKHASLSVIIALLMIDAGVVAFSGAMPQDVTIDVNDPRPLAASLVILNRDFGWLVSYEDPSYLAPSEMSDVTGKTQKRASPSGFRSLVPRGGAFVFSSSVQGQPSDEAKQLFLEKLLNAYKTTGYQGEFSLRRTGRAFHVVPVGTKSSLGQPIAYSSPLDSRVTFPERDWTVAELIATIARSTTPPFDVVGQPAQVFVRTKVHVGASRALAREVLANTLLATGKRLSYRLLCAPGGVSPCALNIFEVPTERGR